MHFDEAASLLTKSVDNGTYLRDTTLVSPDASTERKCDAIMTKLDTLPLVAGRIYSESLRQVRLRWSSTPLGVDVDYILKRAVDWCRHFAEPFPEPIPIGPDDE